MQFTYDRNGNVYTLRGNAFLTVRNANIDVNLGQNGSAGLVIRNGNLDSLDAAVTSDTVLR